MTHNKNDILPDMSPEAVAQRRKRIDRIRKVIIEIAYVRESIAAGALRHK